jgi:hypothetical protein
VNVLAFSSDYNDSVLPVIELSIRDLNNEPSQFHHIRSSSHPVRTSRIGTIP